MAGLLLRYGLRCSFHAAEADGVARETRVLEAGRFADAGRGPAAAGIRVPAAAAEDILVSVHRAAGVFRRALLVIVLVVGVVAPLGHVADHVVQPPGVRFLL